MMIVMMLQLLLFRRSIYTVYCYIRRALPPPQQTMIEGGFGANNNIVQYICVLKENENEEMGVSRVTGR